jgi:hypothetical protein
MLAILLETFEMSMWSMHRRTTPEVSLTGRTMTPTMADSAFMTHRRGIQESV